MRRIAVCLLIAFASAAVTARESKLSDPNGGSCASQGSRQSTVRPVERDAAASPVTKAKTSTRGGGDDIDARLQSPRWHRFLPGMFR